MKNIFYGCPMPYVPNRRKKKQKKCKNRLFFFIPSTCNSLVVIWSNNQWSDAFYKHWAYDAYVPNRNNIHIYYEFFFSVSIPIAKESIKLLMRPWSSIYWRCQIQSKFTKLGDVWVWTRVAMLFFFLILWRSKSLVNVKKLKAYLLIGDFALLSIFRWLSIIRFISLAKE